MKKILVSTCLSMSLFVASSTAKECIRVAELNVEFKNATTIYSNGSEEQEVINFAKFMKKSGVYALVEGHTSSLDNATYNYNLSTSRAVKVMNKLRADGVSKSHVRAMGFGESSPLYDNNTQEGAAQNRRVIAEVFNSAEELDSYVKSQKARIKDLIKKEQ